MTIIARVLMSFLARVLLFPPESGMGGACDPWRRFAERLIGWPAAVFFVPAGPLRAGVVQQTKPNLLPNRALAVEPHGVDFLDLDRSAAAPAAHPQKVLGHFGQA